MRSPCGRSLRRFASRNDRRAAPIRARQPVRRLASADDPVLARFRKAMDVMYGNQIDRVVLYGSRVRGDAREDSDYDVVIFLRSLPDRWTELDRLAALRVEMIDETGAVFDAKTYPAAAYLERILLTHEIRQNGIDL
jgi:uncharacterized protein